MQERNPKIPHRHNRKSEEGKDSPIKQLPTSTALECVSSGATEKGLISVQWCLSKPRVVVLRLGIRRAFVRSVAILVLWYW
jgi:hypothetical protein